MSPLPTRVSLGLPALGERPRGHEVFHDGAIFEFVFDGVCMVWTDRFEKFWLPLLVPCLVLEIAVGGCDLLLVGALLLILLATLSAFLGAFTGGFGRC
jgi:hypothetical protein